MKTIWLSSAMLAAAGVITTAACASILTGCGASDSPTGSESDELSGSSAAPANTIMKVKPPTAVEIPKHPIASTSVAEQCGPDEKHCVLANDKGICVDRCVPGNVMCVAPTCVVCDPDGPAPNPSCKWDSEACEWLCL